MRTALAALLLAGVAALPAAAQLAPERAVVPRERPADAAAAAAAAASRSRDATVDPASGAPTESPAPASTPESAPDAAPEVSPAPQGAPAADGATGGPTDGAETVPQPTAAPDAAPEAAPAPPEEKPSEAQETDGAEAEAPTDGTAAPADAASTAAAASTAEAPEPVEPPMPDRLAESDLDLGVCLGRLTSLGTEFERGRAISEQGGACGIVNPLRVTWIVPGVALSPPGIMRCETALALAEWVARFALPASLMLPDRGRLTEVTNGSAYVCRAIGNGAEGDLSEHAFGNAVDVMGFRFASGPAIVVEPREREGTPAEAFQRAVRATACLGFATVLGPGVEAHEDHLHLDIKARDGGFRLCQ